MCSSLPRQFVLIFSALLFSTAAFAQPIMKRSSFSGTYTPISLTGGATLSSANGDNAFEDLIAIGFPFTYSGTTYSTIGAGTNGIVAFTGISASANNMNLYSTTGPNTVLAPWWDDLNVQVGTGSILYQLQGAPGSQTFTIQWTDVNSFSSGSTALLNFQVILFEQSNKIEFHYGAAPSGVFNPAESASIGIKSNIGGNGEYIDAVTGSCFTGNGMLSASTMWPSHFFRFVPGTPTPISPAVYTVGMTGDYYNLSEAVAALNHRGVTGVGVIVLSLIDSMYDETPAHGDNFFPILLGPINGASIAASIHIEPVMSTAIIQSPGATAGNCVTQNSATAIGITNEPVIGIVGADHTSLSTSTGILEIRSSTAHVDRGMLIMNSSLTDGTRSSGFQKLTISLDRTNVNSIGVEQMLTGTLLASSGSNSWNIYEAITISNAYSGLQITGDATFPDSSVTITRAIIGDNLPNDIGNGAFTSFGIHATNQHDLGIIESRVRNISVNGNAVCRGIWLESMRGICNVYGNRVRNINNNSVSSTSDVIGISADLHATGTNEMRIFNNFVFGLSSAYTGTGSAIVQVKGIYIQPAGGASASTFHVDFNNVSIENASLLISSTCFESGTTSGPVINTRTNIFVNSTAAQVSPAAHFCLVTPTANLIGNSGSISNNNDFFIPNAPRGFIGKGNTSTYASLANWQAAMSSDALTLNVDPLFATSTDIHVLSTALNASGIPLAWVPMDIDNQVRNAIPDIGADEIFPPDPSPVMLVSPVAEDCYTSTESVIVRVMNAGTSQLDFTIDTVPVTLQITGMITQTMTILLNDNSRNNGDPLPIGGYADVDFGTINMTALGNYTFNARTSLSIDGNPYNDTMPAVTIVHSLPQVVISGDSTLCASTPTTYTAIASGGGANYSYLWSHGLGTDTTALVAPTATFILRVSITDGCGVFANDSLLVQVQQDPSAGFTYNQTSNTITFTDTSHYATGWSWDFGDTQSSNQQSPSHTYTANGTYTVVLTITNECGTDTESVVISIITTGINSFDGTHTLNVFPNPTSGSFTVFLPEAEKDLVIEFEDMNGKLLRKRELGNTMEGMSFVMDISGFENGIYFLRVSSERFSEVQKVVVEK
jgi:PKD repeat protein